MALFQLDFQILTFLKKHHIVGLSKHNICYRLTDNLLPLSHNIYCISKVVALKHGSSPYGGHVGLSVSSLYTRAVQFTILFLSLLIPLLGYGKRGRIGF